MWHLQSDGQTITCEKWSPWIIRCAFFSFNLNVHSSFCLFSASISEGVTLNTLEKHFQVWNLYHFHENLCPCITGYNEWLFVVNNWSDWCAYMVSLNLVWVNTARKGKMISWRSAKAYERLSRGSKRPRSATKRQVKYITQWNLWPAWWTSDLTIKCHELATDRREVLSHRVSCTLPSQSSSVCDSWAVHFSCGYMMRLQ